MLEKPDLRDDTLIACLNDAYDLRVSDVVFLPLGADVNTAVYQARSTTNPACFVKLRYGEPDIASVMVPRFLHDRGVTCVLAPILTRGGELWTQVESFTLILYPFVVGVNGFDRALSDHQWFTFGATLKGIHTVVLPPELKALLPRETYSPVWRDRVNWFQRQVDRETFADPVAAQLAALLRDKRDIVSALVERAEQLANVLRARSPELVLCHADIHAGNVLVDAEDALYIVDWDTLTIAPKERDLMFIGAGVGSVWNSVEEEALFQQGYGPLAVDREAIAYYRYERIIQDIAAFCEELLLTDAGGADRAQGLRYFAGSFAPNSVIDLALAADPVAPGELGIDGLG